MSGHTTRQRIGAKDSLKSKIRLACQKLDKMLLYKNQIDVMPELKDVIDDIELPMEMFKPWLSGEISPRAFDKYLTKA